MPENDENLFQVVLRHAELIKAREAELGKYFGDGPTHQQVTALIETLQTVSEATTASTSSLWAAFRIAVDVEMSWLFPERDPLGQPMTTALRDIQTFTGNALQTAVPEMSADLQEYAALSIVVNGARRTELLHGNKIIWRLVLARALHTVGKFFSGS